MSALVDGKQAALIVSTGPGAFAVRHVMIVSGGDAVPVLGTDNTYSGDVNPENEVQFRMMLGQEGEWRLTG